MSLPTLVLIPGMWEGPTIFDLFREALQKNQAAIDEIVVAPLQSTGKASPGNPTLQDDIAGIRAVIQPLVESKRKVWIVAHSAGAFIASAATKDLEKTSGGEGGVEHFFFISAGLLPPGSPPPPVTPFMDFQGDKLYCKDPESVLFNMVPPEVTAKYIKNLTFQPSRDYDSTVDHAGWMNVSSTYVICKDDQCIPPPIQEQIAQVAKSTVFYIPGGHLALLSSPKEIAEMLKSALNIHGYK